MEAQLNLYDINKQIISQMSLMSDEDILKKISEINEWVNKMNNNFFLSYGKEISYFTFFKRNDLNATKETLGEALIDCLKNIGEIISIDKTETEDAFEIWIKYKDNETCLYLFPFDQGVIEYCV